MSGIGSDIHELLLQQFGQGVGRSSASRSMAPNFSPASFSNPFVARWLTYMNAQSAENLRTMMALGQCKSPDEAVKLWAEFLENSQQHLVDAGASMVATASVNPDPVPAGGKRSKSPVSPASQPATPEPMAAATTTPVAETSSDDEGTPPERLSAPEGEADDLKKISGIGPLLEQKLNSLGIYHFSQIAKFTPRHIRWVDGQLRFRGRIERERWVEQAKLFASEGAPHVANGTTGHAAGARD